MSKKGTGKGRPANVKLTPAHANNICNFINAVIDGGDYQAILDKEFCDFETGADMTGQDVLQIAVEKMQAQAASIAEARNANGGADG
jgi:hypothetical protein